MSEPLTLSELREVILGLRMNGFAYIDDESVMDAVRFGIEKLPSAEELDNLKDAPEALKNIGVEVGRIAQLIEKGSKKDESYKVRNMARKNLPPRYQVLEWRDNMKQQTANLVKGMVKTSARADELGKTEAASQLLKCAKLIVENKAQEKDIQDVIIALRKAGMEKEAAGMWDYMKGFTGGIGKGIGNVFKGVWQAGQAGGLEAKYNALYKQIVDFKTSVDALAQKAQDPNVQTRMKNLSQQIEIGVNTIAKAAEAVKAAEVSPAAPAGAPAAAAAPAAAPAGGAPVAAAPATPAAGGIVQVPGELAKNIKSSLAQGVPKQVLIDYLNKLP